MTTVNTITHRQAPQHSLPAPAAPLKGVRKQPVQPRAQHEPMLDWLSIIVSVRDLRGAVVPPSQVLQECCGVPTVIRTDSGEERPAYAAKLEHDNDASILLTAHAGGLLVAGNPTMWLLGHNAYTYFSVATTAKLYLRQLQSWFRVRGFVLEVRCISRVDLAHMYDCMRAILTKEILEACKRVGTLGRAMRSCYVDNGIVWGAGSKAVSVSMYLGLSKTAQVTGLALSELERQLRIELRLHVAQLNSIMSNRSLSAFLKVDWRGVYDKHVARLKIEACSTVVHIDSLDKYTLTRTQRCVVDEWFRQGGVPCRSKYRLHRKHILEATAGAVDIFCPPNFASRWSGTCAWEHMLRGCCTYRPFPAGRTLESFCAVPVIVPVRTRNKAEGVTAPPAPLAPQPVHKATITHTAIRSAPSYAPIAPKAPVRVPAAPLMQRGFAVPAAPSLLKDHGKVMATVRTQLPRTSQYGAVRSV